MFKYANLDQYCGDTMSLKQATYLVINMCFYDPFKASMLFCCLRCGLVNFRWTSEMLRFMLKCSAQGWKSGAVSRSPGKASCFNILPFLTWMLILGNIVFILELQAWEMSKWIQLSLAKTVLETAWKPDQTASNIQAEKKECIYSLSSPKRITPCGNNSDNYTVTIKSEDPCCYRHTSVLWKCEVIFSAPSKACGGSAPLISWRFCLEVFFMLFMPLTDPVHHKPNTATFSCLHASFPGHYCPLLLI